MSHSPDSHLHSPPRTPPKKNINMKGLSWLARSHSSNSNYNNNSSTSTTKIRISEPRFASVLEYTPARTGVLGSGAVVVKTPMEALAAQFRLEEEQRGLGPEREKDDLPASPVLPPVPFQTTPMQPQQQQQQHYQQKHKQTHASPRLPHFAPILLGPAPVAGADPARIIVALETGTATHRTTLATLSSRASHLALYLAALLPDADADDAYAQSPVFASIFHAHLAESGLLTQASSSVHVFLDRPSAPYEHIVAYLRTPPSTRAHPATLPRALHPSLMAPAARTAALLELRDEARWLALDELYILCAAELLGVAQEVCVPRESVASRYSAQTATPEEQDVLEEEEEERAQAHAQEEQMLVVVEVPEEDEEEADDFAPRAPAPDDAMASCRSRDTVAAIYATYSEPLTPLPPLPPFPAPKSASSSASTSASTPASTSKARSPPPPPPKISHAYSQSTAPSYAHSTAQQPVPAPSMRGSAPPATPLFAHFARGNGSGDEEQDDVVVVRPDAHAFGAGPPTPTPKSFSHPPAARPTHKISASVGMGVRAPVRGPPGPGWI